MSGQHLEVLCQTGCPIPGQMHSFFLQGHLLFLCSSSVLCVCHGVNEELHEVLSGHRLDPSHLPEWDDSFNRFLGEVLNHGLPCIF